MPQLKDDRLLKSAAWFSFSIDAANNLFPQVVSRAALPLWIANEASKKFSDHHKKILSTENTKLNMEYGQFKDQLADGIDTARREFSTSRPGRLVYTTIKDLMLNRPSLHDGTAKLAVREVILESSVINAKNQDIRQALNTFFAPHCEKILLVHRAYMKKQPIFISSSGRVALYDKPGVPTPWSCQGRVFKDLARAPEGYLKLEFSNKASYIDLLKNISSYKVSASKYSFFDNCKDSLYASRTASQHPISAIQTNYQNVAKALKQAYAKLYPNELRKVS